MTIREVIRDWYAAVCEFFAESDRALEELRREHPEQYAICIEEMTRSMDL